MLRPARDGDLETMLTWRNQAANREVSNHSHVIGMDEHRAWWERVRNDPAHRVLVYSADGRDLGVVTFFDVTETSAGWGFYLDSEGVTAQGLALTAWMAVMKEAVDHAFDELGVEVLTGEVLAHNEAVRMMNRRFRFTEGEPTSREVDGRTITVIPIELRRENRRTGGKR